MSISPRQAELFEHYTDKTDTHWVWQGTLTDRGYPRLTVEGLTVRASHIAVQLDGVDIPEGYEVAINCGEKLCVNPTHLEVISSLEARRRPRKPRAQRVILDTAPIPTVATVNPQNADFSLLKYPVVP